MKEFLRKIWHRAAFAKRAAALAVRQLLFGAKIALFYPLKKKNAKRIFFILCHYRTGSNLFISYLNTVPGVCFDDEILSPFHPYGLRRWWVSKQAVYRHVRHSLHHRDESVRGAKFFFENLQELNVSLKEMLREFPDARWFMLYRKNILEQYLSHEVAKQTNRWVSFTRPIEEETFRVLFDPAQFSAYRDQMKRWYQEALKSEELLGKSVWVSYEELTADPQKLFDEKVFPFAGLPQRRIHTRLVKQNTRPISEMISNYTEIREAIEKMDVIQNYEAPQ